MSSSYKKIELKIIFWIVTLLFLFFLAYPIVVLLTKSFIEDGGVTSKYYLEVFKSHDFMRTLGNSFKVAGYSAVISTAIGFVMAYIIFYTNVPSWFKNLIKSVALLPMLLPTITYGFAIIYSFGKEGLITRLFGRQLFNIYGIGGLLIGYVIYTVPVAFLLICNTMVYVDKKTIVVSRIMGDSPPSTFWIAIIRPLLGTFACAFIQSFFLSFTDFGIPASVGGKYNVIASTLYNNMLGGIPNFNSGAVVAVIMLLPSVGSIILLHVLEKYNIRYSRISQIEIRKDKGRDVRWGLLGIILSVVIVSIFFVIFIIPVEKNWPYQLSLTFEHFKTVFSDDDLLKTYENSLVMAFFSALLGTMLAYGAALITSRSKMPQRYKSVIESISLVTNAIPGMVIGVAYMFIFPGTPLQNTLLLMIICNVVHYFSTPYLMMKNALSKMNLKWETTGMLMGDSWLKTVARVVTPNSLSSLMEVFSYYFINSMVTISALIFIAGARTMVLVTKIKELQYLNRFNEVFVLSILVFLTNVVAKLIFSYLAKRLSGHTKEL